MRIVPVLDLRDGQVVRAGGGDRRRYEPLRSPLVDSSEPSAVAKAFVKNLSCADLYVADLQAIAGETPDWHSLDSIVSGASIAGEGLLGFSLHVDAGANTPKRLEALLTFARQRTLKLRPIVALETLHDPAELSPLAAVCQESGAFSLDLRDGRPMTTCRHWQDASPRSIAEAAIAAGFTRLIVIDIARVGGVSGVAALPLCYELHRAHPRLSLWAGGGVRGPADLEAMAAAGVDGALVASALHEGCLSAADFTRCRAAR